MCFHSVSGEKSYRIFTQYLQKIDGTDKADIGELGNHLQSANLERQAEWEMAPLQFTCTSYTEDFNPVPLKMNLTDQSDAGLG